MKVNNLQKPAGWEDAAAAGFLRSPSATLNSLCPRPSAVVLRGGGMRPGSWSGGRGCRDEGKGRSESRRRGRPGAEDARTSQRWGRVAVEVTLCLKLPHFCGSTPGKPSHWPRALERMKSFQNCNQKLLRLWPIQCTNSWSPERMTEKSKSAHLCASSSARRFSTIGFCCESHSCSFFAPVVFLRDTYPALL